LKNLQQSATLNLGPTLDELLPVMQRVMTADAVEGERMYCLEKSRMTKLPAACCAPREEEILLHPHRVLGRGGKACL
jgi:hypothetical protein